MRRRTASLLFALATARSIVGCYDLDAFGPSEGNQPDAGFDAMAAGDGAGDASAPGDATIDSSSSSDGAMDGSDAPMDGSAPPTLSLSSAAADFGAVGCGEQPSVLAIVITNVSGVSEDVTEALSETTNQFSVALETPTGPGSTVTLAPGKTVTMLVSSAVVPTSSPNGAVPYTGVITITANPALPSPLQVPISETPAGGVLEINRAVVSFGLVDAGATETLSIGLANVGNYPLSIQPAVSGVDFSVAGLAPDASVVVDAGAAGAFSLAYAPTSATASLGLLTLTTEGTCAPGPTIPIAGGAVQILAAGLATPAGIAVDSTSIYWANGALLGGQGASVMKAPITGVPEGGAPTTLVALSGVVPVAIAVDANNVYWANEGKAIMAVPIAGGDAGVVVPNAGVQLGAEIAQDATNLYWAGAGSIMTVPKIGGAPTTLASGQPGAFSVAVDATSIYWTAMGATGNGAGTVMSAPLSGVPDGGAPTTLASGLSAPAAIAVSPPNVYWVDTGAGASLMAVGMGGGPSTTLVTLEQPLLNGLAGLVVDESNVYVACAQLELSVALDGGAARLLAQGSASVGLAQNAGRLFWTDSLGATQQLNAGVVASIPK